jgi:hypothetical protein
MSKQDFDKNLALWVTSHVSTMNCAYLFCIIALVSLPAILTDAFHIHVFPSWMIANGLILIVAWIAQTFIQLVLLSVIMVGQQLQAEATINHVTQKHDELKRHLNKLHKGVKK